MKARCALPCPQTHASPAGAGVPLQPPPTADLSTCRRPLRPVKIALSAKRKHAGPCLQSMRSLPSQRPWSAPQHKKSHSVYFNEPNTKGTRRLSHPRRQKPVPPKQPRKQPPACPPGAGDATATPCQNSSAPPCLRPWVSIQGGWENPHPSLLSRREPPRPPAAAAAAQPRCSRLRPCPRRPALSPCSLAAPPPLPMAPLGRRPRGQQPLARWRARLQAQLVGWPSPSGRAGSAARGPTSRRGRGRGGRRRWRQRRQQSRPRRAGKCQTCGPVVGGRGGVYRRVYRVGQGRNGDIYVGGVYRGGRPLLLRQAGTGRCRSAVC